MPYGVLLHEVERMLYRYIRAAFVATPYEYPQLSLGTVFEAAARCGLAQVGPTGAGATLREDG